MTRSRSEPDDDDSAEFAAALWRLPQWREEDAMRVVINPGTGPVDGASEANAVTNMRHFLTDVAELHVEHTRFVRVPELDDGQGRYGFLVWADGRCCEVQMPGLPLERVRFIAPPQDPWQYPRLYVDRSSWLWCYAVDSCATRLGAPEDGQS